MPRKIKFSTGYYNYHRATAAQAQTAKDLADLESKDLQSDSASAQGTA